MHHATMSFMLAAEQVSPERLRPLKRAEYDRLVELGAFADERIELLRGALVAMSPQKAAHAHAVTWLSDWLTRSLGDRALVRCQCPLAISDESEPEPDLVVVPRQSYRDAHPAWAHLVVEVADSSLRKDREVKRDAYAEAGIPDYWIVNVIDRVVEVHRLPRAGAYAETFHAGRGSRLHPLEFPDAGFAVDELFGS